jgi:hypothetical protein
MTNFSFPLLLAGLLTAAAPASPAEPAGAYTGAIEDRGPVPFTLTLDKEPTIGRKAGTLRFHSPWTCGLDLEYSGEYRNTQAYAFLGAGLGRCVTLAGRRMAVREVSAGFELELDSTEASLNKAVTLKPSGKPN